MLKLNDCINIIFLFYNSVKFGIGQKQKVRMDVLVKELESKIK